MDALALAYVVILLIGFSVALVVAAYVLRVREFPGAKPLLVHLLLNTFTIVAFILLSISRTEESAFLWARLRFLSISFSSITFVLFVLKYTGKSLPYPKLAIPFMLIVPIGTQIILWSGSAIPIFFSEWSIANYSFLTVERSQFGMWFQLHAVQGYSIYTLGFYVLIAHVLKASPEERTPLLWITAAGITSIIFLSIPAVVGNQLPLNPSPIGLTLTFLMYAWGLLREHFFNELVSAYHTIFLNLQDGVIVLNKTFEIVQWNSAAQQLFGSETTLKRYIPFNAVLALVGYPGHFTIETESPFEMQIRTQIFEVHLSPLKLSNGTRSGTILLFRNVTKARAMDLALQKSEALYRLLADNSLDLIMLNVPMQNFMYVSPSCTQVSGYSVDELLALSPEQCTELTYSEDRELVASYYSQIIRGESPPAIQYRIKRKDGSISWVENRAKVIYDPTEKLTLILTIARDVNERTHMDAALRESNRRYDTLVQNIPAVVYQLQRAPSGAYRLTYLSPNTEDLTGYTPEALLENPCFLFDPHHPEQGASLVKAHEISAAQVAALKWEGRGNKNGQNYWFRLEAMPTRIEDGSVLWNGVHLDITAQKEAELALEHHRRLLERIAQLIPDIVQLFDISTGEQLYINRSYSTLLGYTEEEFGAMSHEKMQILMHPDDYAAQTIGKARYKNLRDDEIMETESRWTHKTVGSVWLNVREVVYDRMPDGTVRQVMGIIRDVTARKTAEEHSQQLLAQLQAANNELKDFAYIVSHDLKAPLRGVNSLATWLIEQHSEQLPNEGKQLLDLLMGRVRRMEQMINGVLEYSRIGREQRSRIAVDLNRLVKEIIQDIVPGSRFTVTLETALPTLHIDDVRIRQVFQNLIDNAVKFMNKARGEIQIGCTQENSMWRFYVRDNGQGIAPEHFDRIFHLFQTLVSKDQVESTGVGLALTKRIVEYYSGKIWVESTLGQGSTFYFTLPLMESSAT